MKNMQYTTYIYETLLPWSPRATTQRAHAIRRHWVQGRQGTRPLFELSYGLVKTYFNTIFPFSSFFTMFCNFRFELRLSMFNFIDIYSFIPVSYCVVMGPIYCFVRGL
jgi:hypothetical protein